MAILNFFKKNKEKERFLKKKKEKGTDAKKQETAKIAEDRRKTDFKDDNILILESPYMTEKSNVLNEQGVYVFKISAKANKIMVKKAIEKMYNVHVEKVNILRKPPKIIFVKGKWGRKTGFKKAVVYLKKGENIEI